MLMLDRSWTLTLGVEKDTVLERLVLSPMLTVGGSPVKPTERSMEVEVDWE
jgi:hypothetical protein